ncbi:MAG: DUF5723 family protein [Bacteroidia bacterium]|nr:DUF5723 family protein [Bacteroidia bacterium]
MNKIFRVAAVAAMTIVGAGMTNAQESVLMLMQDVPQQLRYNPALATSSRSYFILPGIGGFTMSFNNTGFSFEDLYVHDKKSDEWKLNLDHLAKNFKGDNNILQAEVDVPVLATGVRLPKGAIFWSISNRTMAEVTLPKSILDLRYGNYDFDKQKPISHDLSDIGMKMMNFNEIALGGHYQFFDHVAIGVTVKYLAGLISARADNMHIKMETIDKGGRYSMHVVSKGEIEVSAPLTIENDKEGYVDDVEIEFEKVPEFMTKNSGFAVDLGARMNFFDNRLRVGASVIDLGFLNWKVDVGRFVMDADYTYEGKDVSDNITDVDTDKGDDFWDEIGDELSKFKDMKHKSGDSYKTKLSPKVMAFGQWAIKEWLNVGAVLSLRCIDGNALTKTTANISLRPNHHFEFIFSGGMQPGGSLGIGGGIQATAGPFQFMLASDNMNFNIKKTKGAQISFGINWLIGSGEGSKVGEDSSAEE